MDEPVVEPKSERVETEATPVANRAGSRIRKLEVGVKGEGARGDRVGPEPDDPAGRADNAARAEEATPSIPEADGAQAEPDEAGFTPDISNGGEVSSAAAEEDEDGDEVTKAATLVAEGDKPILLKKDLSPVKTADVK